MRLFLFCIVVVYVFSFGMGSSVATPASKGESTLSKGIRAFQQYSFETSISLVQRAIREGLPTSKQSVAYAYLATSLYNTAALKRAESAFVRALTYDNRVAVPSGQGPAVYRFFAGVRKRFLAKLPRRKVVPARRVAPVLRRKMPNARKRTKPPTRVVPRVRVVPRRVVSKAPKRLCPKGFSPAAPGLWEKQGRGLVVLGLGVAFVLAGGITTAQYITDNDRFASVDADPTATGQTVIQAHDATMRSGIASISLHGVGGVLVVAGAVLMVVDSQRTFPTSCLPPARK